MAFMINYSSDCEFVPTLAKCITIRYHFEKLHGMATFTSCIQHDANH